MTGKPALSGTTPPPEGAEFSGEVGADAGAARHPVAGGRGRAVSPALGRTSSPVDEVSTRPSGEAAASRFYPIGGVFYRVHVRHHAEVSIEVGHDAEQGKLGHMVYGWVRPALGDQRVVVDVAEPGGRDVETLVVLTEPDGSFRVGFDLARAYDTYGGGTYVVHSFVFDADQLDDAASNRIQLAL